MKNTYPLFLLAGLFALAVSPGAAKSSSVPQSNLEKARSLLNSAKFAEAESVFKNLCKESLKKSQTKDQADLYNYLGVTQHAQGKNHEAVQSLQKAINLCKLGTEPKLRQGKILSNLALAYLGLNESQKSLDCCETALHLFGNDKEITSTYSYSVLLSAYGRSLLACGRLEKAKESLQKCISLREQQFGKQHHELVSPLTNLSLVLLQLEQPGESELASNRALAIARKAGDQAASFYLLNNLAQAHLAQHAPHSSKCDLYKARDIANKLFDKAGPQVFMLQRNLSEAEELCGNKEASEKCLTEALQISRSMFGHQAPSTMDTILSLSELYEAHGKTEEAQRMRILYRVSSGGM